MSVTVLVGKLPDVARDRSCQARGGVPHAGPVRSYTFTAEDHCPECEADIPVARFVLRVDLCGSHAQVAIGLGMVPLGAIGG